MTSGLLDTARLRQHAYGLAAGAHDAVGRITAPSRVLPTFLIVGAQRCGTTSMYKTLAQHPAVLPAGLRKGIHYFDTNYDRGLPWYRAHFPLQWSMQRVAHANNGLAHTGESSPYYLFHPLAAERIARDLPGIKVLVLLRDPVERAYSGYTHERARGFESESFERALDLEERRLAEEDQRFAGRYDRGRYSLQHHAYIARGRYIDQLLRLERALGRSTIHVVDSDRFFDTPESEFGRVLDFLGLAPQSSIVFERHNARPRSPMEPSLRADLAARFVDADERLASWLGWTPSWIE